MTELNEEPYVFWGYHKVGEFHKKVAFAYVYTVQGLIGLSVKQISTVWAYR